MHYNVAMTISLDHALNERYVLIYFKNNYVVEISGNNVIRVH